MNICFDVQCPCKNIKMKCYCGMSCDSGCGCHKSFLSSKTALQHISKTDFDHLKIVKPKLFMIGSSSITWNDATKVLIKKESKTHFTIMCEDCKNKYEIILTSISNRALMYLNYKLLKNIRRMSTPAIITSLSSFIPRELEPFFDFSRKKVLFVDAHSENFPLRITTKDEDVRNIIGSQIFKETYDCDLDLMFSRKDDIIVGSYEDGLI